MQFNFLVGAEGRGRTGTLLPTPDFESGASANSATSALLCNITTATLNCQAKISLPSFIWLDVKSNETLGKFSGKINFTNKPERKDSFVSQI